MDEVDVDAADVRGVLRKRVQLRFLRSPIEARSPVACELLKVDQIGAELPRLAVRRLVWPADMVETLPEIRQCFVGHMQPERSRLDPSWLASPVTSARVPPVRACLQTTARRCFVSTRPSRISSTWRNGRFVQDKVGRCVPPRARTASCCGVCAAAGVTSG